MFVKTDKMKKLLLASIFFLSINSMIFSQADDIKKRIIDSTCECLNNTPDIETKTSAEIEILISQCMIKKAMPDFIKLAEERNIDMSDQEAMKKLGMEIGVGLVQSNCKTFQKMMMGLINEKTEGKNTTAKPETDKSSITGKIINISYDAFLSLTIESPSEQVTLIWSNYVENGDDYINNLDNLKNKTFTFSYIHQKVYNVKLKKYTTANLITRITQ